MSQTHKALKLSKQNDGISEQTRIF